MATFASKSGLQMALTAADKEEVLKKALAAFGRPLKKVLIIPPDITRLNSNAGFLPDQLYKPLSPTAQVDIIPA